MRTPVISLVAASIFTAGSAWADGVVDHAKAVVAKLSGPQTEWTGPTAAPKPAPGMKIAYLSGDENNDICRLYGVFMGEAAAHIGWTVTVVDGKGTPTGWNDGMREAVALQPNGIAMCADAASLQGPIKEGLEKGIIFIGLHAAANKQPPSDFIQPPFLVTHADVDTQGGDKNMFFPGNGYKAHYLQIWGSTK